jgi:glycerophosphoryl diester phosphodiesterase
VVEFLRRARRGKPLQAAYYALQVPERVKFLKVVTPATIAYAHDHQIAVQVWTINDRAVMDRLLDWGVDGIFSDDPVLLGQAVEAWGRRAEVREEI